MTEADIEAGMRLKTQTNWNQTSSDWRRFLQLQPHGCFVAETGGQVVGTVTTCVFGCVGWIGMLLVDEEYRGQGIGTRLMQRAMRFLSEAGATRMRLDATEAGRPLHEKMGFRTQYRVIRFAGIPRLSDSSVIEICPRPFRITDLPAILSLDRTYTNVNRARLLARLVEDPAIRTRVVEEAGTLAGYLVERHGTQALQLGPSVADSDEAGHSLLVESFRRHAGQPVYVDMPAGHVEAVELRAARGWPGNASFPACALANRAMNELTDFGPAAARRRAENLPIQRRLIFWLVKERKQLLDFFRARTAAILANLKGLGILDLLAPRRAIEFLQFRTGSTSHTLLTPTPSLPQPVHSRFRRIRRRHLIHSFLAAVGSPFVNLGNQFVHGLQLLFEHVVDADGNVWLKGIGLLEGVLVVQEHRVFFQWRSVGTEERNGHHVGGILDQDSHVPMIRMIVPGAMRHHDVGIPFADQAHDQSAILERWNEFTVVDIQNLAGGSQHLGRFLYFGRAALSQRATGHLPVPDISVGDGDQFHLVPQFCPLGRSPSRFEFGIIRMSAETDDLQFAVLRLRASAPSTAADIPTNQLKNSVRVILVVRMVRRPLLLCRGLVSRSAFRDTVIIIPQNRNRMGGQLPPASGNWLGEDLKMGESPRKEEATNVVRSRSPLSASEKRQSFVLRHAAFVFGNGTSSSHER